MKRRMVRTVWVVCPECQEEFPEDEVEMLDVSEDSLGRDLVVWKCPECKEVVKSLRRG